jgi:hypothetical protein
MARLPGSLLRPKSRGPGAVGDVARVGDIAKGLEIAERGRVEGKGAARAYARGAFLAFRFGGSLIGGGSEVCHRDGARVV